VSDEQRGRFAGEEPHAPLSENLAMVLDTEWIERWPLANKIGYQIELDAQRFEATSDGQSQLVATW
jgi:hypothetical protein